jgi:hypothetical protein
MSVRIVKKSCLYELEKPRKFGVAEPKLAGQSYAYLMGSLRSDGPYFLITRCSAAQDRFKLC